MAKNTCPNPFEDACRLRKAGKLSDVLTTLQVSAADLAALDEPARVTAAALTARIAGTTAPSERTWAMVVDTLARREQLAAALNPFVGLPR